MAETTISFDKFYNIIDGEQRSSNEFHQGVNPATKEKLYDVPIASEKDIDDAVAAANAAFPAWSKTPFEKRKELLLKFVDVWKTYHKQFSDLLTLETGKTRKFSDSETSSVGGLFTYHAHQELPVDVFEDDQRKIITRYVPLGVTAAICPWNFPLSTPAGKIAAAITTGGTVVVKPSPFTPYTTLKMVELAQQVFPKGVISVVSGGHGGSDIGPKLVGHTGIAKVSFTGSIATGKRIMAEAAKTLKRVTLELGGNDVCIVMPDVDVDKVVREVVIGSFWNSGQVCVATKRAYIHESIYREFVDKMIEFTKSLKVGSSDEDGVMVGPVQNEMQYEKVKTFFADSKSNGYKFGMGNGDVPASKGFFINPTIIDNPPNDSKIIQEEQFGPILPVQPWSDLEEVIKRSNDSSTGLAGSIWSKDVQKAQEIAERIETGSMFINQWTRPIPQGFFGGHKESGIGGEWGKQGILSFCNCQVIHIAK